MRPERCTHLLCLLGLRLLLSTQVAADVSRLDALVQETLDGLPALPDRWGHVLPVGLGVDPSSNLANGSLDEGALGVPGAEKDSVGAEKEPGTLPEEESRAKETEPEDNLENGDESHAAVIVVLDEAANGVGKGAVRLGLAAGGSWGWASRSWRWVEGGKQVGAGVGRDVEDRVDGEWEDGERDLVGDEPDKCHHYRILADHSRRLALEADARCYSQRYCTFSSPMIANGPPIPLPARRRAFVLLYTTIP